MSQGNIKKLYQAYADANLTVPKTRQIVMLYDAIIRNIQQAKDAIGRKDYALRFNLITRAGEIIYGLQGSLDFENGGDVAKVLYDYYSSIDARLFTIHRTNNLVTCDQLIAELKQMRDVWQDIDSSHTDNGSAAPPPAPAGEPGNIIFSA